MWKSTRKYDQAQNISWNQRLTCTVWKSTRKRDHVQKFRQINSLLTSLVKCWFDGKNVDFCAKIVTAFYNSFPHCDMHTSSKNVDLTGKCGNKFRALHGNSAIFLPFYVKSIFTSFQKVKNCYFNHFGGLVFWFLEKLNIWKCQNYQKFNIWRC